MAETSEDKKFTIAKVYIKDISFEAPKSPAVFSQDTQWKPDTKINLSWAAGQLSKATYEAVLTVTITALLDEEVVYLVEIQQAGLFVIKGYEKEELEFLLRGYCPNVLFPFAREAVSELVNKGGFPRLLLKPVDFDVLYAQNKAQLLTQDSQPNEELPE